MNTTYTRSLTALFAAIALFAAACGSDDGAEVRSLNDDTAQSAGASTGGSSASSSASSVSTADAAASAGDGGYEYASNVDSHRLVVSDICDIGDLLDAGDFAAVETIYRDGVNSVNSDGSVRSIGGFATREERSHGLDSFYGTPTPLDDFVSAALAGTGMFAGEPDAVRGQGVEKGMQNQVMIAWVVHELNAAIAKAADSNWDVQSGAVHNWDEGWAFYHGVAPGCAPYATADKRAGNFGTTGSGDTSLANEAILQAMIDGRDALLAEDIAGARTAADDVLKNVGITYSQAAIRYAHLVQGDLADGDAATARVHQAEGLAFWRVAESILVGAGADGDAINSVLGLDNDPGANGGSAEIRAALAPAWNSLGITADDIGALETEDLPGS